MLVMNTILRQEQNVVVATNPNQWMIRLLQLVLESLIDKDSQWFPHFGVSMIIFELLSRLFIRLYLNF